MKILKTEFRKNGLDYTLLKRTDKIALFQLGPSSESDDYEVCRIYKMRLHKAFGIDFKKEVRLMAKSRPHSFLLGGSRRAFSFSRMG